MHKTNYQDVVRSLVLCYSSSVCTDLCDRTLGAAVNTFALDVMSFVY